MAKKKLDMNQLAKAIVDIATREADKDSKEEPVKNPAAVALGRLGGLKGGKARAAKALSQKAIRNSKEGGGGSLEKIGRQFALCTFFPLI
jgi:hypothetical protein